MNNIFRALNVTSEKEMNKFVESLNLEINDYINFMSMLNETLEPNTIRENLFKLTETLYNGSYEKLQEQCSKKPFKRKLKEDIETEDNIEDTSDEKHEQKSSADPEITQFISTTEKVVNNTTNPDILQGILDSINSKIDIITDVEQANKLGELKQKTETKLMSSEKVDSISESIDYDKPEFEIGDNVEFYWGDEKYTGRVVEVRDRGTYELYNIISYNPKTKREETFTHVDPIDNLMKKISDDYEFEEYDDDYEFEEYDDLDETCSAGATCAANVSGFAKPIGTTIKRNRKKVKETFDSKLFKESILNDMECASKINGKNLKYFLNEGKFYMSVDDALVKTFNKAVMIETVDEILYDEDISYKLLEGYSCYEMNILMEDEDIFNKIGRIAGTYDVKTNDVKFLNPGEFHGDVDYENGIVRFGIQRINGLVKCYITAFDKGYAIKTYNFIKKYYKKTPIDEFELEIINDNGTSMFIKLDYQGKQIFEGKDVKHCDSKSIKKILESQDIDYDYALHQSIINSIMEDVTANPLNPNGNEQTETDEELKEPKNDEEQKYENDLKSKIGNTSEKYVVSSLDDENSVLNYQEIIGFDDKLKKFILKGPDGKTMYSDSRNIKKMNESVLTEGIVDVAKYFPRLNIEYIKKAIRLDPTYQGGDQLGKYSKWILRLVSNNVKNIENEENYRKLLQQYPDGINPKNGQPFKAPVRLPEVTAEDRYKITQSLKKYDMYKEEIGKPIDAFKTLPELDAAISDVEERGIPAEKLVRKRLGIFKDAMKKGLKKVYEDGKWIVGIPETHESSKMFGDETSWCTTSNGRYYNDYSSQGPLFINLNKDNGRLYQFHFQSSSFMNEYDTRYNWEDGGDIDGFFQENPFLEHFYKDYVRHEEDPRKTVDSLVSNRDRLDDIFDNVYNLTFDGNNITGRLDIEDIKPIYRDRDTVSLSFISKMLNGDWFEAFNYYDERDDGLEYNDGNFDSEIKKISEKGGIDLTKIKWSEIIHILKTDGGEETENFTEEEAKKLYDKMTNDFYDYMSIWTIFSDCRTNGAAREAYNAIKSDLIDNLPLNPKEPFNNSDLNIYIPYEDLVDMCSDNSTIRVDIENDTTWYDRLYNNLDFSDGWLYAWYSSKHRYDSFGIYEPSYGWDGFDDSTWNHAISDLVHFIHVLKRGK